MTSRTDAPTMLFVLGSGRCGSTLVHEILAHHDSTGFVTNLDDQGLVPSSRSQVHLWRHLPIAVTRKGRARFAPSEAYRALEREVGPIIVDPARDIDPADVSPWLVDRLRDFVQRRQRRLQLPFFLHKFTGWPRAALLEAAFPQARYLHVVRDGRAVVNSWLQMPWWRGHRGPEEWHFGPLDPHQQERWSASGSTQAGLAALGWDIVTRAHDLAEERIGDRWLTVRYEDVVQDAPGTMSAILDHLRLPADDTFEKSLQRQRLSGGRTAAYTRDLSPAQLEVIDDLLGDRLAHYGYR